MQPNFLNFEWELSNQSVINLCNVTNAAYYKICSINYYTESGWAVYTAAQGFDAENNPVGTAEHQCITPCFTQLSSYPPGKEWPNETSIEVKLTRDQLELLKSAENTVFITGSFVYTGGGAWSMNVKAKSQHSFQGDEVSVDPCISPC